MAFSTATFAALIESNGFTMWHYVTADTRATVTATGYFATVAAKLRAGDLMLLQTADAMAMLPIRSGPVLGTGVTLDGVVGALATVRNALFNFTVNQSISAIVRTIVLAPLAAGIVVGGSIPVSAQVTGAISTVVFGIYDTNGTLVPPAITAPVIGGSASAILPAPPLGTSYRIRARDGSVATLVATSFAFNVGPDLQFLLQEDDNNLLLQTGSGLKQS
jgi:hypothetical protein